MASSSEQSSVCRKKCVLVNNYLISTNFSNESLSFVFTPCEDGIPSRCTGWSQMISMEDFEIFCKMFNPSIQADTSTLVTKLEKIITTDDLTTTVTFTGSDDDDERTVTFDSPLGNNPAFTFKWKFDCRRMSDKDFIHEFMLPMYTLAATLNHQCELLQAVIVRKDQEIQEHKANGSELKRVHLETRPFEKESFGKDSLHTQTAAKVILYPGQVLLQSLRIDQLTCRIHERKKALEKNVDSGDDVAEKKSPVKRTSIPVAQPPQEIKSPELIKQQEVELEQKRREEIQLKQNHAEPKPKKKKKLF